MANELYRTYEVLVEESVPPDHPKRAKDKTKKPSRFNPEIDGALRDTHMIFQDAVCYNTLCFAGLAGTQERGGELLNPLWKHLTTPAKEGGIKHETEDVIRRLATHYAPLKSLDKDGVTAEEFVNLVYSEPLRIRDDMTDAERQGVLDLRAKCYRILEQFGAPTKDAGGQECADMSAFANTWAGLTSKPESDTEIPGNLAYDRVCRELKETLKTGLGDGEEAKLLEKTLLAYSAKAEDRNKTDCALKYAEEREERQKAIAEAEALPETDADRATKQKRAKAALEEFEKAQPQFKQQFFKNRSDGLKKAVKSALAKPFATEKAGDVGLSEEQFNDAKTYITGSTVAAKVDTKALIRLHYKGGNPGLFEKAMFRYWLLRDDDNEMVRRAVLADFRKFIKDDKPDPEPTLDGAHIAEMPFKSKGANIAFPLFGKKCLGIETIHSSPDWDFDKTAYATAAEDVFKYKIRSDARRARVRKLLNVVQAYENCGAELAVEASPTGKPLNIRGMGGDPRWKGEGGKKGIGDLLKELSKGKEIVSYGLREGTIGGWADVRKEFLSLHKRALGKDGNVPDESGLAKGLEDAVDKEMEANRQGFGSADFFYKLCEPEYFHLWLSGADYERHGVKDFIPHYVGYCEWREELVGLLLKTDGSELEREADLSAADMDKLAKRAIRYTWPGLLNRHKKPSYRYYDFAGDLNTAFQFKSLFRRVRAKDATGAVKEYKQLKGDDAKVTLAARRLKRDKIINKDTGNSVDALWCPPLILAGEEPPTTANRPRAGKYEDAKKKVWPKDKDVEVSFSLMASPLPGDPWMKFAGDSFVAAPAADPVHLTVSFKIEANALATLQNEGVYFAGGSAKGVDEEDEKRKFLRWPVDIESDKQAAKDAAEKAKREAKEKNQTAEKKTERKADVAPDKLWCAFDGGFLVKESRYSKPQNTKRVSEFHILGVDLGNRFAAAFTRFRIHADPNGEGREISADGFSPVIKAELTREGTLRLQGENAKVWDHVQNEDGTSKKDAAGNYVYALEDELFGNGGRGRFPTSEEYSQFAALAARLVPVVSLSLAGTEKQTYPELGDHLVFRLKRRIGRLRTLFNLVWRLCAEHDRDQQTGTKGKERGDDEKLFHRRMVIETLARSAFPKRPRQPGEGEELGDKNLRDALATDEQWQKLKADGLLDSLKAALRDDTVWNWEALATAVKAQIKEYVEGGSDKTNEPPLSELLAAVVEFCLPLRGRSWFWRHIPNGERLSWTKRDSEPDKKPNVLGMRGLSMKRLEQVLNLRQRCQSFAKLEDRYHGPFKAGNYNPPDSSRDERPDCCPKLLDRSNRIREQRVDQTAHLILAEALGMELKNPAEVVDKKARKAEVDLHGEYQRRKDKNGKPYPRCSVIVLENLERYKTSQERTKVENSRLMQWAHRAIIDKLEDMCRPFGITLMLVDPAFSSHFDSRTGLPGVRVNQVSPGFEQEYPYNRWIEGKTKSGAETQLAKDIKALVKTFAEHPKYKGELVLAVEGGKEFLPVASTPSGKDGPINADVCAAGNIGLRGVADPQRWDIFPRLRTKQVSDTEVSVLNWRGWFGHYLKETEERLMRAVQTEATSSAQPATGEPKKGKKQKAKLSEAASTDSGDSQTGQSSEYPSFFVGNQKFNWPPEHDWLRKEAYKFQQKGAEVCAYPQGAYLKRVELVCSKRIEAINEARIQRANTM